MRLPPLPPMRPDRAAWLSSTIDSGAAPAEPREYVMRIVGLAHGAPSDVDGAYVEDANVLALRTTRRIERAQRWPTQTDAWEAWRMIHPTMPVRTDGRPNRPLTAFTVEIVPEP